MKHTEDYIEVIRLIEKTKTSEGREVLGEIVKEINELMLNAVECEIFEALSNIRNIGLHTGMYMVIENIPPHSDKYEKIVNLTRNVLIDVTDILKRHCGLKEL
jgi:uncharacterized protein (UPF0128 family)